METKVQIIKFGGTSVGSGESVRRVAHIIMHKARDTGEDFPVVVVSAAAGVTDQLLRIAKLAYDGEHDECETELYSLKQKHLEAAKQLSLKYEDRYSQLIHDLETAFSALQQDVTELKVSVSKTLTQ
jgi:aspartokinase